MIKAVGMSLQEIKDAMLAGKSFTVSTNREGPVLLTMEKLEQMIKRENEKR